MHIDRACRLALLLSIGITSFSPAVLVYHSDASLSTAPVRPAAAIPIVAGTEASRRGPVGPSRPAATAGHATHPAQSPSRPNWASIRSAVSRHERAEQSGLEAQALGAGCQDRLQHCPLCRVAGQAPRLRLVNILIAPAHQLPDRVQRSAELPAVERRGRVPQRRLRRVLDGRFSLAGGAGSSRRAAGRRSNGRSSSPSG